jgi:hypothetical protein
VTFPQEIEVRLDGVSPCRPGLRHDENPRSSTFPVGLIARRRFRGSACVPRAVFGVPPNTFRPAFSLRSIRGAIQRNQSGKGWGARRAPRRSGRSRSPNLAVFRGHPLKMSRNQNPRFFLDTSRLYANLLRVTTWHIWPGRDGTKTWVLGDNLHLRISSLIRHGKKNGCMERLPQTIRLLIHNPPSPGLRRACNRP